jgi:hypothetical protein
MRMAQHPRSINTLHGSALHALEALAATPPSLVDAKRKLRGTCAGCPTEPRRSVMLDPALFASFSNAEKFDHAPCRCSSTSSTASTIPGVTTALVPGSTTHRNGFDTARLWVKPCRDRPAHAPPDCRPARR